MGAGINSLWLKLCKSRAHFIEAVGKAKEAKAWHKIPMIENRYYKRETILLEQMREEYFTTHKKVGITRRANEVHFSVRTGARANQVTVCTFSYDNPVGVDRVASFMLE